MVKFYPHEDRLESTSIEERLDIMQEAIEQYKAVVLDVGARPVQHHTQAEGSQKRSIPRDLMHSPNWEEIARLMREIRDLPEGNQTAKTEKAAKLKRLAEIYEILRAAKMPKLEAVRLALMSEANQLGGSTRVA